MGQDRVLRQLRLGLSQQRRARRHDHGRSQDPAIRSIAATPLVRTQGRGARHCAPRSCPNLQTSLALWQLQARLRAGVRRRRRHHRGGPPVAALWHRVEQSLATDAVALPRPGSGLEPRPIQRERAARQLHPGRAERGDFRGHCRRPLRPVVRCPVHDLHRLLPSHRGQQREVEVEHDLRWPDRLCDLVQGQSCASTSSTSSTPRTTTSPTTTRRACPESPRRASTTATFIRARNEAFESRSRTASEVRLSAVPLRRAALDLDQISRRPPSMRTAVSSPPQTQPVSRPSRSGRSTRPSVDQWPNAIGVPAVRRPGASNQGKKPGGRGVGAVLGVEVERAVGGDEADPRQRVEDEAQARRRRSSESLQRAGSLPYIAARKSRSGALAQQRLELAGQRQRRAPGPIAARRRRAPSASRARGPPCAAGAASRARPRGRARRGCRRGCRCVARGRTPCGDGQQVQVVVAEQAGRGVAEAAQQAQRRRATPGRG